MGFGGIRHELNVGDIVNMNAGATNPNTATTYGAGPWNTAGVAGIAWQDGPRVVVNRQRPAIRDLDRYRPGWELVDWPGYRLFGVGRSAGMQFSRGCPLTCTYCGQWLFWKKWRHRSPRKRLKSS